MLTIKSVHRKKIDVELMSWASSELNKTFNSLIYVPKCYYNLVNMVLVCFGYKTITKGPNQINWCCFNMSTPIVMKFSVKDAEENMLKHAWWQIIEAMEQTCKKWRWNMCILRVKFYNDQKQTFRGAEWSFITNIFY